MTTVSNPLSDKRIVLGVSGGIAAYKAVLLVRLLTKAGARTQVVMTEAAQKFVGELTFQTLTGRPVFTDMFDLTQESEIGHIQVADRADLVIVAPATANTIARASAGLANDALGAVLLATRAPVLLAPSMNVNMWANPSTQRNLGRLMSERGYYVVGPGDGFLACRWTGPGRLAEPEDIVEAAARVLTPQDLAGKRVVISAGPTREALDPVRFLSNRSSGKMGYALARAANRRGAEVVLVSGPVELEPPPGVALEKVTTAAELEAAVVRNARGADAVIMAAAVADYRPAQVSEGKIKKAEAGAALSLALESTTDVLAELGAGRTGTRPVLVGFAAETGEAAQKARAKLERKGCDLIVANDVSASDAGFAVDTNRVSIVSADGIHELPLASKLEIANGILDHLVPLVAE